MNLVTVEIMISFLVKEREGHKDETGFFTLVSAKPFLSLLDSTSVGETVSPSPLVRRHSQYRVEVVGAGPESLLPRRRGRWD